MRRQLACVVLVLVPACLTAEPAKGKALNPAELKNGDKGKFAPDQRFKIVRVRAVETLVVVPLKVDGGFRFCLNGIATADLAEGQSIRVTQEVEVMGTIFIDDAKLLFVQVKK